MDYNVEGKILWERFIKNFIETLNVKSEQFKDSVFQRNKRTKFYTQVILPEVAGKIELKAREKEYLRVDSVFEKKGLKNGYPIPKIFIESENDIDDKNGDLPNEIHKLCCLNAPLKVLIIWVNDWSQFQIDIEANDTHWKYILEDFCITSKLVGCFGVIAVGKSINEKIAFHSFLYGENGKTIGEEQKTEI